MLQIRPQQFDAFEKAALANFEDEMVVHLREFQPGHIAAAGEVGLRSIIQTGIARAKQYGFTLRGAVRFYLEQMVTYGYDYDTDPMLPWANLHLKPRMGDELSRADQMHSVAMTYRKQVFGEQGEHEQAAIGRLIKYTVSAWLAGDNSPAGVEAKLREVYPEKCSATEPAALRMIIAISRRRARDMQLPEPTGGLVLSALSVALGHGYMVDPMYPWVAANLKETAGQPGDVRVEKLATRSMAFLSAVLAEHE